jgi:hypothetical protein
MYAAFCYNIVTTLSMSRKGALLYWGANFAYCSILHYWLGEANRGLMFWVVRVLHVRQPYPAVSNQLFAFCGWRRAFCEIKRIVALGLMSCSF